MRSIIVGRHIYVGNNPIKYTDPTGMRRVGPEYEEENTRLDEMDRLRGYSIIGTNTSSSPTDRLTYVGGDMQNKNNYVYRDHINDQKNDIEVFLPDYVIEASAPKMQIFRGVAIAYTPYTLDFQFGGELSFTLPYTVIYITAGPDKGKFLKVQELIVPPFINKLPVPNAPDGFGVGGFGGGVSSGITVYDYTGTSLRNFRLSNFLGASTTVGWGTGKFLIFSQELSASSMDEFGGIVSRNRIKLGLGGYGTPISVSYGHSQSYGVW